MESNNVYKLRPRLSKHNQMHIFYNSLESRGVPKVLFNGYINGLNLEINNKQTKLVITDGLTLATQTEWQVFIKFKAHDMNIVKMKPLFGAHSDFED